MYEDDDNDNDDDDDDLHTAGLNLLKFCVELWHLCILVCKDIGLYIYLIFVRFWMRVMLPS